MLDKFCHCPYCGKKTMYLVIGYLGQPGGDEVRCYKCKRQWITDFTKPTKEEQRLTTAQPARAPIAA